MELKSVDLQSLKAVSPIVCNDIGNLTFSSL
jgi:hypothetical protein